VDETSGWKGAWSGLSRVARMSLIAVTLGTLVAATMVAVWAMRDRYAPLFTELNESEAGSVLGELKRLKIPYRLVDGGATIHVPEDRVYDTRITLVAAGAPMGGGVGFELFDKQGLGTTEQSQRVSYQRALQGELSRTVGALEAVRQARVHLVLPETALFRREKSEPRAAVALILRAGAVLTAEQVFGIQRLVAASVQNLDPARVVVSDQYGVVLSQSDLSGRRVASSDAQLTLKRHIEEYVAAKVAQMLDRTFGAGRALVSVDATLNFDEITRTQRDVLPMRDSQGRAITRLSEQTRGGASVAGADMFDDPDSAAATSESRDVQYEYGRRVEQVVAAPGAVTRLTIGVVLPRNVSAEMLGRVRELVTVAAGLNSARGDALVVQTLDAVALQESADQDAPVAAASGTPASKHAVGTWKGNGTIVLFGMIALTVICVLIAFWLLWSRRAGHKTALSDQQRHALLVELKDLLRTAPEEGVRR
jgi:flagellar M-ring protein FliF